MIVLLTFFISTAAYADRWCQWSGTEGENCKNDSKGILNMPFPTKTETLINTKGYYRVTINQPSIEINQVKDTEIWDKVGNQISLTWTVRTLSDAEIDARDSEAMPLSEYYLWKVMLTTGIITQQQAQQYLPAELIEAYRARNRMEN